jgi:thiol-disulfide isomerase/thioredoxin
MNCRVWVGGIVLGCLLVAVSAGCRKKEAADLPQAEAPSPSRQVAQPAELAAAPIPAAPQEQPAAAKPEVIEDAKPSIVVIPESKDVPVQPAILPAAEPKTPEATGQPVAARIPDPPKPEIPAVIADDAWTQDYDAAMKKAAAENKDLLLDFTGSDWCPWCIRLDEEVFGKEEFKKAAGKLFVLVKIDFPDDPVKARVTEAMQIRNEKLQVRYSAPTFPTILLTDGCGRPYAKTAYKEGGPDKYLEHLRTLQQVGRKIRESLAAAGKADTAPDTRLKLYDQGLSQLPPQVIAEFYQDEIDKVVELDPQNQAGIKNKYLLIREFTRIQVALDKKNYALAKDFIDAAIGTLKPTGADAQNLYYARALAAHFMGDTAGEKESLQKAIDAAPNSEGAAQLRRIMEIYFPRPPATVRPAKIETNLKTYQTFVPERAFDGNPDSYFWASGELKSGDFLTVILDQPAALQEIRVLTGSEQAQQGRLYEGAVEVSEDGRTFDAVGEFRDGIGYAKLNGRTIKAVRIRCTKNQTEWLVMREIELK